MRVLTASQTWNVGAKSSLRACDGCTAGLGRDINTGHTVEPHYLSEFVGVGEFVGVVRRIFLLVQFGVVVDVPAVAGTSRMVLGTVLAQCLVRLRIHVLSFLWYFYGISYVNVDSDPEDDCPALHGVAVLRSSSTTAVACILLVLLVFMHLVSFLRLSAARGGGPSLSW